MSVFYQPLINFFPNGRQLTVPIYQRKYSWEAKHWAQLFEDINKVGNSSKKTHFMGSLVYKTYVESLTTIVIIDGQQRVTTLSLLIAALANFLLEHPEHNELIGYKAQYIVDEYLYNSNREGQEKYKIVLTEEDNVVYKHILKSISEQDKAIITDDDKKNQVYKAYDYFTNKIDKENIKSIWDGIKKLQIITIDLMDSEDSPQEIFESLNSTGKTLDDADKIRNFILMDFPPKKQQEIYDEHWHPIEKELEKSSDLEGFIKNYMHVKRDNWVKGNEIYEEFKKIKAHEDFKDFDDSIKMEKIVEDIKKYWGYYRKIVFYDEKNPKLKQSFKSVDQLPYTVVRPFLMRLYEDYANKKLSPEDFCEIIYYTESYLLRRTICDRDSQSIKGFFDRMHKRFRDKGLKPNEYLKYFKDILSSRTGKTLMPDDEEFEKYFTNIDLFNKKRVYKYVLVKLTNYKTKDIVDFNTRATVEHIMPQNPDLSEEWQKELSYEGDDWEEIQTNYLHKVGNLTLTSANSELGDKPFMIKRTCKKGYDNSNYNINKYFKDNNITHWNKDEINKRGKILFNQAKEIWGLPEAFETKRKENFSSETVTLDSFEKPNKKYWTMFKEQINNSSIFNTEATPSDSNDFSLGLDYKNANISLKINSVTKEVKTQLIIKDKELYEYLEKRKDQIRYEINHEYKWESLETNKWSYITATTDEFDLEDDLEWENSIKWQIGVAEEIYYAFYDRIQEFKKIKESEKE